MRILVTGSAGFVGAHTCQALQAIDGFHVVGIDNYNSYYDPALKRARIEALCQGSTQLELDITDSEALQTLMAEEQPDAVVHLAAQAGVRHSFLQPMDYASSNLYGQVSLLEAVRNTKSVKRLMYASSSSVYSGMDTVPFHEGMLLKTPKSLYAASKIADEVLSDTYSSMYAIDMVGLRFFTVYGPWGRPDMAYWTFADAILNNRPIRLFNHGNVRRDFTYIDDIVTTIVHLVEDVQDAAPEIKQHRVYNIGNHKPEPVGGMIEILETLLNKKAEVQLADLPPGDMVETFADVSRLQNDYGFSPDTSLQTGLERFVTWFQDWRSRAQPEDPSRTPELASGVEK
ncbi:MAG: NAD-dependent epimerase/dehydratase family protein [Henriciella sp.]|nr:NAD-dependent epimerase/dehydratase family protein [Henriciella sp.]